MNTADWIRNQLQPLAPLALDVIDESSKHVGHEGAKSGGHFHVLVVSHQFDGKPVQLRHRMVYSALGNLTQNGIHALSISALTPDERRAVTAPQQ
jgi:BolA protein